MSHLRKTITTLGLALLIVSPAAYSDSFKRIFEDARGDPLPGPQGSDICDIWGRNLNEFARRNEPLSCHRPVSEDLKDLGRPKWEPLDARKHEQLVQLIDRTLFYDLGPAHRSFNAEAWKKRFDERLADGGIPFSLAHLDLDEDGQSEIVLRYGGFPCTPTRGKPNRSPAIEYFVANDDLTKILRINTNGMLDLLVHKGQVYGETVSWMSGGDAWVFAVFAGPTRSPASDCERHFMPDKCSPSEHPHYSFIQACRYTFSR